MSAAASENGDVMTLTAGTPLRSAITASCKLHDEQLPHPLPAQHGVPSHSFFHQLNFGRRTVIRLGPADDFRNP